jgi:hypothetical protein
MLDFRFHYGARPGCAPVLCSIFGFRCLKKMPNHLMEADVKACVDLALGFIYGFRGYFGMPSPLHTAHCERYSISDGNLCFSQDTEVVDKVKSSYSAFHFFFDSTE